LKAARVCNWYSFEKSFENLSVFYIWAVLNFVINRNRLADLFRHRIGVTHELRVNTIAQAMQCQLLHLANSGSTVVGDAHMHIGFAKCLGNRTSPFACQGDDTHVTLMGRMEGAQKAFFFAIGSEQQQDITGLTQCTNLPGQAGISGVAEAFVTQSDGGQLGALALEYRAKAAELPSPQTNTLPPLVTHAIRAWTPASNGLAKVSAA
jgi:hypothetical protein